MSETSPVRVTSSVRIVGAGLLGASIGLALKAKGIDVILADSSPSNVQLACDLGAGRPQTDSDSPGIVVVCVPPDVTADVIEAELSAYPNAVVTDVASVKQAPLEVLAERKVDLSNYIGSHPLAGREKGGAISARADLFVGRPWVVCREDHSSSAAVSLLKDLILDLGAVPIEMTAHDHDIAVGLVSHVPQLISSVMAKQLENASDDAVRIAGQGVRDVTRIAHSSPELWIQILSANHDAVVGVLENIHQDLDQIITALKDIDAPGSRSKIAQELSAGNAGVSRLPGKHGQNKRFAQIVVLIDDRPGQLANLLGELGELNINVEDLRLEHAQGAQMGLVEFSVLPDIHASLVEDLNKRGWRVA